MFALVNLRPLAFTVPTAATPVFALSDDDRFAKRTIFGDSCEQEIRQVEGFEPAEQYQFGHGPADDRRLLHAMARESIHEQEILERRMRAQDGVVVKGVHLEVAGPRPLESGLFECGNAMREGR